MSDKALKDKTGEQIQGIEWAYRRLLTSPLIRGEARKLVKGLCDDAHEAMVARSKKHGRLES